jgi:hypothetical protein
VPRSRSITAALLAMPLAWCAAHQQEEGRYAFTAEEVLSDECRILESSPELSAGTLRINGQIVAMDYEVFGVQLRGEFEEVSERFYLDGTAPNVTVTVGEEECLVDLAHVHLVAKTESPSAFTGTLRIRYETRSRERCRCELSVQFRAEITPAAP